MRRFFYTDLNHEPLSTKDSGDTLLLPDDLRHHWCRVLRANVADTAVLFDGHGGERSVTLSCIQKKEATVVCHAHHHVDRLAPICSTVGLVMSRGDRLEYAIQKATELGVGCIQLLTSERGEVRLKASQVDKKLAHLQQVVLSACEQCGLNRPPPVLSPVSLTQWLTGDVGTVCQSLAPLFQSPFYSKAVASFDPKRLGKQSDNTDAPLKLVLSVPADATDDSSDFEQTGWHAVLTHCHDHRFDQHRSKSHLSPTKLPTSMCFDHRPYVQLLIGPEGGLSDSELAQALQSGFVPWQIGHRILRTETAPVVALSLLNHGINNMKFSR